MHKTITGVTVKDAAKGEVSAVFSTFNVVDKDGDLTLPGAIKDGTEVVISSYGHGSHSGKLPVGKGVIRTTETEAILDGKFFMDTVDGRDTFTVVKELGPLGEWSYHLADTTRKSSEVEGRYVSIIEDIGLIKEVSPVLIGAGVNTRTLDVKGLKFTEEGDTVLAAVDAYLERAGEVMALRGAKGRSLGQDSADRLKAIDEALVKLRDLLVDPAPADADIPEDLTTVVKGAHVAFMRKDLFSNFNAEEATS